MKEEKGTSLTQRKLHLCQWGGPRPQTSEHRACVLCQAENASSWPRGLGTGLPRKWCCPGWCLRTRGCARYILRKGARHGQTRTGRLCAPRWRPVAASAGSSESLVIVENMSWNILSKNLNNSVPDIRINLDSDLTSPSCALLHIQVEARVNTPILLLLL